MRSHGVWVPGARSTRGLRVRGRIRDPCAAVPEQIGARRRRWRCRGGSCGCGCRRSSEAIAQRDGEAAADTASTSSFVTIGEAEDPSTLFHLHCRSGRSLVAVRVRVGIFFFPWSLHSHCVFFFCPLLLFVCLFSFFWFGRLCEKAAPAPEPAGFLVLDGFDGSVLFDRVGEQVHGDAEPASRGAGEAAPRRR